MTYTEALAQVQDIIRAQVARTRPANAAERDERTQAARIGVWYALRRWSETGGASWRTWAGQWVRAYVEREAWGESTRRHGATARGRQLELSLSEALGDGTVGDVLPAPHPTPEARAIAREDYRRVEAALVRREPRSRSDRRINPRDVGLALLRGESQREMAARLGVTRAAVSLVAARRLREARTAWEAA